MHTRTSRSVIALPGQARVVRTELAGAQRAEGRGAEMVQTELEGVGQLVRRVVQKE